jgi:predicted nucleic acid-binding protein
MSEERAVLVDASVFITLAKIDQIPTLENIRGSILVPQPVQNEISSPVAAEALSARTDDEIQIVDAALAPLPTAADHLGKDLTVDDLNGYGHQTVEGDVALLGVALLRDDLEVDSFRSVLILTDDKPLRKTCKALSIPVSGSIGVLVRAVERGDLDPEDAKASLEAMDEVGARLSASLLRRAERLIDDAAGNGVTE